MLLHRQALETYQLLVIGNLLCQSLYHMPNHRDNLQRLHDRMRKFGVQQNNHEQVVNKASLHLTLTSLKHRCGGQKRITHRQHSKTALMFSVSLKPRHPPSVAVDR